MPLSDLFKKPAKKEPAQEALPENNPFGSTELQKKRYDAALEFLSIFQERTPLVGGKPHAGTVLAVAGRLAGSSLYRALNAQDQITPGVVVLSEEANEAWPELMDLFAFYCKQNGIDITARPPVTQFPEGDRPRMSVEQVLTEYQDAYQQVMQKYGLGYLDAARAGMILCSIVFEYHCKKARDIDPFVGAGIVAMGIVEGAKTAPPPLGSPADAFVNTLARDENRLLLGEREAVLEEARARGGIYIDPNPEVLSTLQRGNVDPYIIYEQALQNQIEQKVPRIDFVSVDADRLYEQWKSAPAEKAPPYVRLLLWLKDNAAAQGYEQRGNSWVRKR